MEENQVSVLITYYNQKKYIQDSLGSVLRQRHNFNLQVICGDDGSTDGTYEELLEWQKKYPDIISVFQMDRNPEQKYEPIVRVSNNRVELLKKSTGRYVTFLDGDDYYTDDMKLQKQFDILENNPLLSCCCHSMLYTWEDHSQPDKISGLFSKKPFIVTGKHYWESMWLHAEAFLYRNTFNGDYSSINSDFFDDNLITAYFIKSGNILFLPEPMIAYRQVTGSSWNMRNELQKAYVNLKVFYEARRVLPSFKFSCFMKTHMSFSVLYKYRNAAKDLSISMNGYEKERFIRETEKYKDASLPFKMGYVLRWFIPTHCHQLFRIKNRLNYLFRKHI